MKGLGSLVAVGVLFYVGMLGGAGTVPEFVFGIVVPYAAAAVLLGGLTCRVLSYAKAPVPFRIPTTCGQQKSLPWIKQAKFDNPSSAAGVVGRMFLEIACFRSLVRNVNARQIEGGKLAYRTSLGLWLGAMAFHWSMLVILLRHLRFFTSPPSCLAILAELDGLFDAGVPVFYVTSMVFLAALAYLLLRRLVDPQVRYISLAEDYFLLFLLLGIGLSGFWLRHVAKTDVAGVTELAAGLASFRPALPRSVGPLFFGHLFLVCVLAAYIPFSKVMHLAGALLSPARNLANNSRAVRHVNPWDYPVKTHSYEAYEDEWREKMKAAGVPVDKE
jgi:nitrate reductase gamma subunit